ncbi:MAG: hypothetical protein K5907_05525 [Treponema sp.]|nr:hypothetical protein [Treponema sp.]
MKRKIFFLFFLYQVVNLFCNDLHLENFVVKQNTSDWQKETFYLGQIKSESEFNELISTYSYKMIGDYEGFKNIVKIFDENIELFYTKNEVIKLVEIRIKTNKYHLYNTNIQVGRNIKEGLYNYYDCFENYKNEGVYYFTELEDFINEFDGVSFLNISVSCKKEIIDEIILYYSFSL